MSNLSTLGTAAVWYCEHGFAIFPLKPRSKEPATKHGLNDWFDDPDGARDFWSVNPNHNIGIVCGNPSHGLLVFDLDVSDSKNGMETLKAWERAHGDLPETAVAITGSGGRHYLYRTNRTNIRPSTNPQLGVDVRCDGSYIVAPPSVHPSGESYEWWADPADVGIASADGNVYDFLDHVRRNGSHDDDAPRFQRFELPARIAKGERNHMLYKYGCSLRGQGLSDEIIRSLLRDANNEKCDEPVSNGELNKIVDSVLTHGPGHNGMGEFVSDRIVGAPGSPSGDGGLVPNFRTDRGKILHNLLARVILERNHACHIDGAPAVWTGTHWEFGKQAFVRVTLDYADDATASVRDEVFRYIQARAPHVESDNGFDGRYYVQFKNATFDVLSGATVEPTPDMLIIGTLPIDLDLDAPYGAADEFISKLAANDEDTERAMHEIVGMCMCSRQVTQQSPFLIGRTGSVNGNAANGKSTFLKVLRSLLGSQNVSVLDLATLGQRFQAAALVGKLANLGDDIPDGYLRADELSAFKKLVDSSGIYTDVKNADGFDFKPTATLVFSMNAIPRLADTTEGVFRRFAFVPFRRRFDPTDADYDPHVAERMAQKENLQRLALLGLMALPDLIRRNSMTVIPDMAAEVEEVRRDNDVVRRWMYDQMVDDRSLDDRWTEDVYAEFKVWCDRNGEKYGTTQATFTKRVLATLATLEVYVSRNRETHRQGRKFRLATHGPFSEVASVASVATQEPQVEP